MNKIVKIVISAAAAAALFCVMIMFNVPEKLSAAADGTHSHKVCADTSHENCAHSDVEYEPFPTTPDGFTTSLKYIYIEDDKNYYLTTDLTDDTFKDYQICINDATVNFCLNGHTLEVKCIRVSGSGCLNVCDCGTGGCITTEYWNAGGILETRTGGTLNIYSGKIQVNDVGIAVNIGVHDDNGSDVTNIYGGEINGTIMVGNEKTLSIYGGTVKHDSENPDASHTGIDVLNNATVNINGGSIFGRKYGIVASYSDSTININGGSVESKDKYAIWVQNRTVCNINGGTVTSASTDSCAIYTIDDGVFNINGGEVVGKNYGAVYCDNNGTVKISDGVLRTESTEYTCIYNNKGTLTVSGGKVFGEKYGIRNYNSGATTTISGGTVSCNGTGVYNYSDGVLEINGGEVKSESGTGISNASTLTISGGTISGDMALRNFNSGATATISGGEVSCKRDYGIYNYGTGSLNISGGNVSCDGNYCIYNEDKSTVTISGGVISDKGFYGVYNNGGSVTISNGTLDCDGQAICNTNNGSADVRGGKIISGQYASIANSSGTLNISGGEIKGNGTYLISNAATLNISGGIFGTIDPNKENYIANSKTFNLSGQPTFNETCIYLTTADNINVNGALSCQLPCTVYINSAVPRIFTSGWSTHMGGQKPSEHFKSPYSVCTVDTDSSVEALLRNLIVTFDANGGSCGTTTAYVDSAGKISPIPEATKENLTFVGWFTKKTGGEQVTADTVFSDDATIYAHWTCGDHKWNDTYEKDEDGHWKICTVCNAESEKSGHEWGEGEVTTPPSETRKGVKTYTCAVCGATKTEEIPALGGSDKPISPDSGKIDVEVLPSASVPATKLGTSKDELIKAALTEEEQKETEKGTDIKIILKVTNANDTVKEEDKTAVTREIGKMTDYKLGQYLDVTLLKKIGNQAEQKITSTKAPIKITFGIPDGFPKNAEYSVIRIHDGAAAVLEDKDNDPNTVTIETDKFSTYALAYKESKPTPTPEEKPKQASDKEKRKDELHSGLKSVQTGKKMQITWGRVSGADGYSVYVQYCGGKFNAKSLNQVMSGKKKKIIVKNVNGKKLDTTKNFKLYVVAWQWKDGKKKILAKTLIMHVAGKDNVKYTNVKKIEIKKSSYTLKKGYTVTLYPKAILYDKQKKQLSAAHAKEFRYLSSNKKIATVTVDGKVKAKGIGECTIYVLARNGCKRKIKINVEE